MQMVREGRSRGGWWPLTGTGRYLGGGGAESSFEYAEFEGLWVLDDFKELLFILLGIKIELKMEFPSWLSGL